MSNPQNMLTTQAFALQAGISASTVSKWLRSGKIQGRKQNGKWMIPADQLQAIDGHGQTAAGADEAARAAAPAAAGESSPGPGYSVEEFSALTYLTRFGVERFLREGRLSGTRDASGKWRVDAANLKKPHMLHLLRKQTEQINRLNP